MTKAILVNTYNIEESFFQSSYIIKTVWYLMEGRHID